VTPAALLLSLTFLGATATTPAVQSLGPRPPGEVRRVVTLAPSLTDIVLALGAGERLVGVSRFDERAEVAKLPRVGGFVDPSVEAVLGLKPDLLLVQPGPGNRRPVEALAEAGTPVLALSLSRVDDVLAAERAIGRALGRPEQGEALARRLEETRARVRAQAKALKPVRVLFAYGFDPLVVAGPGSFADELLADAGGINVAADATSPYPLYSVERAVLARPEVVVDSANIPAGKDRIRNLPGLKESRWVELSDRALIHPGPALERGLVELFQRLHPGAGR
jgi:iron complex transport system substrate-binding protein